MLKLFLSGEDGLLVPEAGAGVAGAAGAGARAPGEGAVELLLLPGEAKQTGLEAGLGFF